MPQELTYDKSTLVHVMAWWRQATSHYMSQCWLHVTIWHHKAKVLNIIRTYKWTTNLFLSKTMAAFSFHVHHTTSIASIWSHKVTQIWVNIATGPSVRNPYIWKGLIQGPGTWTYIASALAPLSSKYRTIFWCPAYVAWKRAVQPLTSQASNSAPAWRENRVSHPVVYLLRVEVHQVS